MTNRKQAKEWLYLMVFIFVAYLFSHSRNIVVADSASIFLRTFLILYCGSKSLKAVFMLIRQEDDFDDEGTGSAFFGFFGWITAFLVAVALFWGILKASEKSATIPAAPAENVLSLEDQNKNTKKQTENDADNPNENMLDPVEENTQADSQDSYQDPDTEYVIINDPLDADEQS